MARGLLKVQGKKPSGGFAHSPDMNLALSIKKMQQSCCVPLQI